MVINTPQVEEKDSAVAFFFLFLYTALVLIRPHEFWQESAEWILIKVCAIICFLIVLIAQRPIKLYPQHWMLLALLPFISVSAFLNGWGMQGINQSERLLVSSIIPLFLFSTAITTIQRQILLMWICLAASMFMVHNGHSQQLNFFGYGWAGDSQSVGDGRITYLGFFSDPNDLGMFLVMNIPFVVYFFHTGGMIKKLLMLAVFTAICYGIYLTDSRGTLLGALSLVGLYFLISYGSAKMVLISVVIAPALATLLSSFRGISAADSSSQGRLDAWYDGIQMLIHNPVFGVGMGNFIDWHGKTAHNSYVLIAGELGIPGYSLWGGALILTVFVSYIFLKSQKPTYSEDRKELIAAQPVSKECTEELLINKTLFYSMIGFMITAFFLSRTYTLLLFIFMGMSIASHIRLFKLMPDFYRYYSRDTVFSCMGYCWVVIIAVYLTLKIGLR
ncbi:O-antigen ligase [Motiliproteus sp. MSK22-1]|uniref:O-antigen ligase family protein n=1 Tax=Motiliproteus sp. MSK22-1 TaxID=1897630 RepID=UPI000977A854|nr:O-antigen ligase family protein [Motiliproteus sp. MSK22-1]OMH25664.1 O-antigen polymerase [Motiliproteus sp. MSK22-1]